MKASVCDSVDSRVVGEVADSQIAMRIGIRTGGSREAGDSGIRESYATRSPCIRCNEPIELVRVGRSRSVSEAFPLQKRSSLVEPKLASQMDG